MSGVKRKYSKPFSSFKLVGDENSIAKHVYIDGKEVKGCVRAVLMWAVDEIPMISLDVVSTDIEADEPFGGYMEVREVRDANRDRRRTETTDSNVPGRERSGVDSAGEDSDG